MNIHTHGAYGYDTNDATEEGLWFGRKKIIPSEGVIILTYYYYTN